MKPLPALLAISLALLAGPAASAVEYVRVCSLYGAGFEYIPGTDQCHNVTTGDTRVQTEGGTWRGLLPYPDGKWTTTPVLECGFGRSITLGTFAATDFTPNPWNRTQTQPVNVSTRAGEFVSKVTMSGGFYDPRVPNRSGINASNGLCVRSMDPSVTVPNGDGPPINPVFGNGMLPIACVSNSRIAGMPAGYTVAAQSAYPSIMSGFVDAAQNTYGPLYYGRQLVVTTDFGSADFLKLQYFDSAAQVMRPLAGKVTVSVCLEQGMNQRFDPAPLSR